MTLSSAGRSSLVAGVVYGVTATVPVTLIGLSNVFVPERWYWSILIGASLTAAGFGACVWYFAVERPSSATLRNGALSGLLVGLLTHLTLWLFVQLSRFIVHPDSLVANPNSLVLVVYATVMGWLLYEFFSLVVAGLFTAMFGAFVGAVLGFARRRSLVEGPPVESGPQFGTVPSPQSGAVAQRSKNRRR